MQNDEIEDGLLQLRSQVESKQQANPKAGRSLAMVLTKIDEAILWNARATEEVR